MTSTRFIAVATLAALCAAAAPAHDEPRQQGMRTMKFDADRAVIIAEVGMIVTEKDGRLTVEFIPPADRRPKETAGLDIAAGDEVGMAAGKKVSTVKDLRAAYDGARPGDEFKLGLRRDGKAYIAAFRRLDGKDLPKTMVIRRGGPDEDPNRDVLPALGVALEQKDGAVVVAETFPNAPKEMASGDVVVSLNGTGVKSLKDFAGAYDGVEVGGELKFELRRDGKSLTVVTKRNTPQRRVVVD